MKQIIQKIILIVILVFSIGVFSVRNRTFIAQNNPFSEYRCDVPVSYALGTIDPHFGVPQEKFVSLMQEAEQKWESALGRDVFNFKDDGRVKISLVYDDRQVVTENLKKIMADIDFDKDKAKKLSEEYESLQSQIEQKNKIFESEKKQYEKKISEYETAVEKYQSDLKDYDKQVQSWNSQGGATQEEYDRLVKEKKKLDARLRDIKKQETALADLHDALDKKQTEFNSLVMNINKLAKTISEIAGGANEKVSDYNQTQSVRGEFETGLYVNDSGKESISVFQFADDQDLLAILIHEMGHALGLAHAENETAIMYPKLINQSTDITPDDIAFFNNTCVR